MSDPALTRRRALAGAAVGGLSLPLLAACGGGGSAATDTGETKAPAAGPLTTTADVEVGGGSVFPDEKVVVTQPTAGDFKCFSAVCPHQGCLVASVDGGTINCTCHGSQYSITDGSVVTGPATQPLAAKPLKVSGKEISLA